MRLLQGDCLEQMKTLPDNSIDAIVSDPPYGISFMAKKWDYDVPKVEVWQEAMRVLKPGGHALIACGTRTQHRMVVNIEDAGFEIRDVVSWIYGSGFPKSLNIGKQIDKCNGDPNRLEKFTAWMRTTGIRSREIDDITGTNMGGHYLTAKSQPAIPTAALWAKLRPHITIEIPAWVDELVDRIEAEREVVGTDTKARSTSGNSALPTVGGDTVYKSWDITAPATEAAKQWDGWGTALKPACEFFTLARKPLSEKTVAANVLKWGTGGIYVDGCRVEAGDDSTSLARNNKEGYNGWKNASGGKNAAAIREEQGLAPQGRFPANLIHDGSQEVLDLFPETDNNSASRFFYCAKASKKDRDEGNHHPTVKPTALMQYLCRLITPAGGTVLDPYMGSGSTGKAAIGEGFDFIGCELDEDYYKIAQARITNEQNQ
jgi:DNA modification methylase